MSYCTAARAFVRGLRAGARARFDARSFGALRGLYLAACLIGCGDSSPGKPGTTLPPPDLYDAGVPAADAGAHGDGDGEFTSDSGAPLGGDGSVSYDASVDNDASAPPLPTGKPYDNDWTWVDIEGSKCRDGSGAGYYYRLGSGKGLVIYLNGGGACADKFFCGINPVNVNQDLPIELLIGGSVNLLTGPNDSRQEAPEDGIFKRADPTNPVTDWSMIYVPYCTGDIHSGTRISTDEIPDVPGTQYFYGYKNYGLFLDSFGPSFSHVDQVLLTGSSAGGFGSLFNFDRTQQFFDKWNIKVTAVSDSGVPFQDAYMAPCLQQRWRKYWGLNEILPKDCTDCFNADGGGLVKGFGNYLFHQKYKGRMLGGFVSTLSDQIIRAFYAPGLSATAGQPDDCTVDPTYNTIVSAIDPGFGFGAYTGAKFQAGLKDVMDNVVGPDSAGYYVWQAETHMHLWRDDYQATNGNSMTIAAWLKDILAGTPTKQGPL